MMKPIKVTVENIEKLEDAISEIDYRCSARTIWVGDIASAINRIEEKLKIPKKYMVGIQAVIDPNAQEFPNAYKYTPVSTQFVLERKPSGWFVTNICRDVCRRHHFSLVLPEEAQTEILRNYELFDV